MIKIYFQSSLTAAFTLKVDDSDTIENVKAMIQENEKINVQEYHLYFNGEQLEDEKLLSDYGIQNKSFIRMIPAISEFVKITVMDNNGKTFAIKVNENYSLKMLKSKLQNNHGIPLNRQCFTCFDKRTLSTIDDEYEKVSNDLKELYIENNEMKNIIAENEDSEGKVTTPFESLTDQMHEGVMPAKDIIPLPLTVNPSDEFVFTEYFGYENSGCSKFLIVFDWNDPTKCYRYILFRKYYRCYGCINVGHPHSSIKILPSQNGKILAKVQQKHGCQPSQIMQDENGEKYIQFLKKSPSYFS